jgi:hypothetical protein
MLRSSDGGGVLAAEDLVAGADVDGAVAAGGVHELANRPAGAVLDELGDRERANTTLGDTHLAVRRCAYWLRRTEVCQRGCSQLLNMHAKHGFKGNWEQV